MYSNEFVAPGPGVWELETAHLSRPISRWIASVWPPALQRGFADTARRYGFLVETMEFRMVNGFAYGQLRPVGAPAGAKGPPPKLIFKLLTKLHPEIRRRLRRCKEVFATKSWREDVHRWDNEWRGQIIERNRALQAVDPQTLDSEGLMLHLRALLENLDGAIYRHHSLNAVAMVAPGDFLVHAEQWTGRPARWASSSPRASPGSGTRR